MFKITSRRRKGIKFGQLIARKNQTSGFKAKVHQTTLGEITALPRHSTAGIKGTYF